MLLVPMKRLLLSAVLVAGGLCGSAAAQTETAVLSQSILPKETYLFMSVPSVEDMKSTFAESSAGQLWADPAFDEFKEEISTAFADEMSEGFEHVQETLGLTVEELMAIPTGEVAFAFSKTSNKMGAILLFDFGDHEEQVQGLLEKAVGALSNVSQLEGSIVEHDGTEIQMYAVKAPVAQQTPLAKEFGWYLKDSKLVVSNSGPLLKLTIDNWDGSAEKSLATNEVFAYIMEKCESEPGSSMVTTFVDPVGLFTQLVQTGSLGEAGLGAGMAIGFFPTIGLNQLKGIGSVGEIGDEEFEGVSRSFIYCEQPPQNAMQIFQLDTVDPVPPAWVKDTANAWMATTWKVADAYTAVESMVDMFQGAGALAGMVDGMAKQGPMIHIKNDVIDQLDGKINFVMASPSRETEGASDDILIAIGVKDNEAFTDVLTKITGLPDYPGESREVAGVTVHEVEPGPGQKISFTVANNQLLIGIGGSQLEQAVRNDSDLRPLAESDDFKAVSAHYEEGALAVTFTRPAEQYRGLYDMVRDGKAAENFPGMDDFFAKIDFSKLPPFEAVEKYLAPAGGYWIGDENGVMMNTFSLKAGE